MKKTQKKTNSSQVFPEIKNGSGLNQYGNLTSERIKQIAKESNLSVNLQKDGRLVVYGQPEGIKEFLKKMTARSNQKINCDQP